MSARKLCGERIVFRYCCVRCLRFYSMIVLGMVAVATGGEERGATGISMAVVAASITADSQLELKCEVINRTAIDYSLVEYSETTSKEETESRDLNAPEGVTKVKRTTTTIDRKYLWQATLITRSGNMRTEEQMLVRFVKEGPKRLQAQAVCPLELRISGVDPVTPAMLSQATELVITCGELPAVSNGGAAAPGGIRNLEIRLTGEQLRQLLKP